MKIKSIENNEFNIQFTVSNKCNYNCVYCPPKLKSGSTPLISADIYVNFFNNLFIDNPQILKYEKKFISFTGGEPTIYPGLEILIDFFKQNNFYVNLDTNGSAKMDFWEKNLSKFNITNLSLHPRYGNFNHILQVVKLGIEKKSVVKVGILMDPEYWNRAIEAVNFFKENKVPVIEFKGLIFRLNAESQEDKKKRQQYYESYTPEQMNWIKNNTYHNSNTLKSINPNYMTRNAYIIYEDNTKEKFLGQILHTKNINNFFGYKCFAGIDSLSVKWDGNIEGANCGMTNHGLTFGNLLKEPNLRIKLFETPITCKMKKCGCVSDMRIKKYI